MTVREAIKHFKIPPAVLAYFRKKNLINNPLTAEDIIKVSFFKHTWNDKFLMRKALSRLSIRERTKFVKQSKLTKPEAYVYNRYFNAGKKLYLKQVVDELQYYYKLPLGKAVQVVKKMRRKTYNARFYSKKKAK